MTCSLQTSSGCPVWMTRGQMGSQEHQVSVVSPAPSELFQPGMSETSHCGRVSSQSRMQLDIVSHDETDTVQRRLPLLHSPPA